LDVIFKNESVKIFVDYIFHVPQRTEGEGDHEGMQ